VLDPISDSALPALLQVPSGGPASPGEGTGGS
jgi:hypothetical protein